MCEGGILLQHWLVMHGRSDMGPSKHTCEHPILTLLYSES